MYGGASFKPAMDKPTGKPVVASDDAADGNNNDDGDGEEDEAEKIWLKSGYIDYMENQRKEGWKT